MLAHRLRRRPTGIKSDQVNYNIFLNLSFENLKKNIKNNLVLWFILSDIIYIYILFDDSNSIQV